MVSPDEVPRRGDGGRPGEDEEAGDQRDQHLSRVTCHECHGARVCCGVAGGGTVGSLYTRSALALLLSSG